MFLSRLTLSLSQKFFLFVLLASVLPLLLVGWFALDISRNALRAEADKYTQQLMLEQTRYLELLMQQVESLIANLSTIDEIKQALGRENPSADDYTELVTQARIGYILSNYTHLRGLVSIDIFTNRGAHYHVGDTLNVQDTRTVVRDAIYQAALLGEGQVQWVGIQDNVNANSNYRQVVTAAKMLYATDPRTLNRQPVALLLVNLDPEVFYEHFHAIDLGPDAFIILVDSSNRLVYHPQKSLLGSRISPELLGLIGAMRGSQVLTVDGQPMFVTYNLSAVNGWHLISFIPLEVLRVGHNII